MNVLRSLLVLGPAGAGIVVLVGCDGLVMEVSNEHEEEDPRLAALPLSTWTRFDICIIGPLAVPNGGTPLKSAGEWLAVDVEAIFEVMTTELPDAC